MTTGASSATGTSTSTSTSTDAASHAVTGSDSGNSSGTTTAPVPLTTPVATVMGLAARLRRAPAIHAVGTVYRARIEVTGTDAAHRTGSALVDEPGSHPALVRLSRGVGLPAPLPDVLGFATRIGSNGPDSPDGRQDLLFDTCGEGRLGRHLVRPGRSVLRGHYGSLIAYRVGDRLQHLGVRGPGGAAEADHADAAGCCFDLLIADPGEPAWREWGSILLLEPEQHPELRFSPANDALGIALRSDWMTFRVPSYRASQQQGPFSC